MSDSSSGDGTEAGSTETSDSTDEHEYLQINFNGTAAGSATLDFHLGFDIDSSAPKSGTSSDDGLVSDDLAGDDTVLAEDATPSTDTTVDESATVDDTTGGDGMGDDGNFEASSRYILKDTSWYDLRETVFDASGAITFESHSLMRNINETVAESTANLTDGAKSHSYTASGFWVDVRIDGVDP